MFIICFQYSLPPYPQFPQGERKREGSYQLWSALSSLEELPFLRDFLLLLYLSSQCLFSTWNFNKMPPWNLLCITCLSVTCTGAYMSGILGKVLFPISPSHNLRVSISTHDHGSKQGRICVLGTMSDKLSKFWKLKVWFCLLKN